MYDKIDLTQLNLTAEQFVLSNDRSIFLPYFKCIEEYLAASNGHVLLGGISAIDLLIRPREKTKVTQPPQSNNQWEIYAEDIESHARKLIQEIVKVRQPHIDNRLIAIESNSIGQEYTIFVDTRMILKMYSMDQYRGVSLVSLMAPPSVVGYFGGQINVIADDLLLIQVYRILYSPARLRFWREYFEIHEKLFGLAVAGFKDKLKATGDSGQAQAPDINGAAEPVIDGGKDHQRRPGGDSSARGAAPHKMPSDYVTDAIIAAMDPNDIIVGDYALRAFGIVTAAPQQSSPRLQFITAVPIDELIITLKSVARKASNAVDDLIYIKFFLPLPGDFQIKKYTLYMKRAKGNDIAICDIYNTTSYELIPYKELPGHGRKKFGELFVLLRFKLIDFWIQRVIAGVTKNLDKNKLQDLFGHLAAIQARCQATNVEQLFPLDNYVGNNIAENVAKKKMKKRYGGMYYPAKPT